MARVEIAKTHLAAANVDGAYINVVLTTTDQASDHVASNAQAGDIIGFMNGTVTGRVTTLQLYPNEYGRPTASTTGLSQTSGVGQTSMVLRYITRLDGFVNATGGIELNVPNDADKCFCIRTRG